ncbi:chemotaxis protein CheW [Pseudoxanthomonas sp. JBR18]|uniref:chemotaxis protein CheW n=1 Tax=Pseudoxanthomonas sp. JBR18 TaxID=2969308 RepID=UPI0023062769|nr:chemotaxis protein CheW [Pseudoxanthomonas sp. JBR18]WCE03709.1 chemotaxis protein CheW [Pseudoxanthomonas sp. JBR18]
MSTPGVIDDYLEGLLHDLAAPETPAPVAAVAAPAPVAPLHEDVAASVLAEAEAEADPALAAIMATPATPMPTGPSPEDIAASVLAEAETDPALAAIMAAPATRVPTGPSPEDIAASILAEAESDPALAAIMAAPAARVPAGPSPEDIAASILAEAESDPALAAIMAAPAARAPAGPSADDIAASILAEAESDPALAAIMAAPAASAPAGPSADDIAASILAEAESDPALAAIMAAPAARATPPQPQAAHANVPSNLQSFLPPSQPLESANTPHRRARDRSSRWLRLRCGSQAYALELLKVQEVVLPAPLLALRGTGPSVLGIMNLRGQVVPVIDLGLHLGASPIESDAQTRIVVLEENGETLGLRVSAVEDVTSLTENQIEPPDNARICRISNHLFRGVARLAQRPMILLDAERLLH